MTNFFKSYQKLHKINYSGDFDKYLIPRNQGISHSKEWDIIPKKISKEKKREMAKDKRRFFKKII